ncbi:tetraspanin-17 [Aricia agestis]|uniref:tetraspanin-17 n=1 Tax=Aricia agestis TaxID=91739 RepID=UPI001C202D41|nr:tetraspanin-17 [Aricia agestis]
MFISFIHQCFVVAVEMFIKKIASAKVLFGTFNTIFFTCGFVEVVCGFLLLSDTRRILLSRLLATPEDGLDEPPFYYVALALLASGLVVCVVAAIGVWATYMPGYIILTFYFLLILGLLLCECAAGVAAAVWPRCFGIQSARGGAVGALQSYYAVPDYEEFTSAVDLAQTELECCGMSGGRNYDMSVWQLRRLGPRGLAVPPSCCVQRPPRSHLNPAPLNETRCQEVTPSSEYTHLEGCLTKLEDWYQSQYFMFMISLFTVAVFKLGILLSTVFSCISIRRRRQSLQSLIIKQHKNGDLYGRKIAQAHDEPITAKYVQPNNFYSPRVRNPRIFNTKPNEMV